MSQLSIDILIPRTPSWGQAMHSKVVRMPFAVHIYFKSKFGFQRSPKLKNYFSVKHNCKQYMDLPPIPYYQPKHTNFVQAQLNFGCTYFILRFYQIVKLVHIQEMTSSAGQASELSTGVPPGGQSAVSLSPMTYLSIKKHKKWQFGSFSVSQQRQQISRLQ